MVLVDIHGGLGNQMFQYALARKLKKSGKKVFLDLSWYEKFDEREYQLKEYHLSIPTADEKMRHDFQMKYLNNRLWDKLIKRPRNVITDQSGSIQTKVFRVDNVKMTGYWQSEMYFKDIRDILLEEFEPLEHLISAEYRKKGIDMGQVHSVSVHVRRGDYLSKKNIAFRGGICTDEYYRNAISIIANRVANPVFYFFSDDIAWVKQQYQGENIRYIDLNGKAYEDMWLMKKCKHHIIANSSFSWWGAWLCQNDGQLVIAPSNWKNGIDNKVIYCADWITI